MPPPKIGALLDLLPLPGTGDFTALPDFVQLEIKQIRKGWRALSPGEISEHNLLPKRIEMLAAEMKGLTDKVSDLHAGQNELGSRLIPLVQSVLEEMRAVAGRVTSLEAGHERVKQRVAELESDGEKIKDRAAELEAANKYHQSRHEKNATAITGVIKRLILVEESIVSTKRPTKSRKKVRRK